MFEYSFKIYGVYDEENNCIMVGSTSRPLLRRAYEYRIYKWFALGNYNHRILWEGIIVSCDKEHAHFIRAAKELMWICRMNTWWPTGKNQSNPIKEVLGGPRNFEDRFNMYQEKAEAGRAKWRKENPEKLFENCSKAGKIGGVKGGRTGGKRVRELYPGMAEKNGRRQGFINASTGKLKLSGEKGRHSRWHKNQKNLNCCFCAENI